MMGLMIDLFLVLRVDRSTMFLVRGYMSRRRLIVGGRGGGV